MKSIITYEQFVAFARHNNLPEGDQKWIAEFVLQFHTDEGEALQSFRYGLSFSPCGTAVLLHPYWHKNFAIKMDSLEEMVQQIRRKCLIKTSLPPEFSKP